MKYLDFLCHFTVDQLEAFYTNARSQICKTNGITANEFDEDIQYYIDKTWRNQQAPIVQLRAWACILELTPAHQSEEEAETFINQLRDRILQGV